MTDQKKGRKRAPSRDPKTGKFEDVSPLNDPALLDQAVRIVKAINELERPLAVLATNPSEMDDGRNAQLAAAFGAFLAVWRDSILQQLAADPESMAEVKKKRLEAKHLGNVPLHEQQRVQALAQQWLALPSAAALVAAESKPASLAACEGSQDA